VDPELRRARLHLGPIGLGIAAGSAALATCASVVAPPIVERLRRRLAGRETPPPPLEFEVRLGA
jgi:hypothetical protein